MKVPPSAASRLEQLHALQSPGLSGCWKEKFCPPPYLFGVALKEGKRKTIPLKLFLHVTLGAM